LICATPQIAAAIREKQALTVGVGGLEDFQS